MDCGEMNVVGFHVTNEIGDACIQAFIRPAMSLQVNKFTVHVLDPLLESMSAVAEMSLLTRSLPLPPSRAS